MEEEWVDKVRDGYRLTDDTTKFSVDVIAKWLAEEAYWSLGRTRSVMDKALEHSFLYGVVGGEETTVACVRVVTDCATFTWVCDVFVDEGHRGQGIGTWMVDEVVRYWRGLGLNRFFLATSDAHEIYAKLGFVPLAFPDRFMEIDARSTP